MLLVGPYASLLACGASACLKGQSHEKLPPFFLVRISSKHYLVINCNFFRFKNEHKYVNFIAIKVGFRATIHSLTYLLIARTCLTTN